MAVMPQIESAGPFSTGRLTPGYHGRAVVFGNLGNLADLMRNAGKIREQMERAAERLGELRAEGQAGGGAVKVVANGRLEIVSLRIDPKLVGGEDVELLEDLVSAAVNQALGRAREEATKSMTGDLPGGLGNLGGLFPGAGGPPGGPQS